MKVFTKHGLALAFTVITTTAQQIPSGLPSCAQPGLLAAIQASGCQATNTKCICDNPELIPGLMAAIEDACNPADQAAVQAFAATYCGAGVASSMDASGDATTELGIASTTTGPVETTAGTLTVATSPATPSADDPDVTAAGASTDLPSSITAPSETSSPTALVVDTTLAAASTTIPASMTSPSSYVDNYTATMTYSTTGTTRPTNGTKVGSASHLSVSSLGALAIGMAGLTWAFANL